MENFDNLDANKFKQIKEMSSEEIINELVELYREALCNRDYNKLREMLVRHRIAIYSERLYKDAGMVVKDGGIFGSVISFEDE